MNHSAINVSAATPAAPSVLIERKPFADALAFVARHIVERQNSAPIVGAITIAPAADGGAVVGGTDLDMWASLPVPAAWGAPGAIVVANARGFADAVKAMTGDDVGLAVDGGRVVVECGGETSSFETLPAADLLEPNPFDPAASLEFDAATIALDLARLAPFVSTEETRYYLNGVALTRMERGGKPAELRLAATDGHRMGRIIRPLPESAADMPAAILPRKLVRVILKALGKKPSGLVRLDLSASAARVALPDGAAIHSKLIDGSFPDVERVIPSDNGVRVTVEGKALAETVRRITKGGTDKVRAVKLDLEAGSCALSYVTADRTAKASLPACYEQLRSGTHAKLCIGFNAAYLAAVMDTFGDRDVSLELQDAACPARIVAQDVAEFSVVLMPFRVDGATVAKPASAAAPAIRPVETPADRFKRDYSAAFAANDGAAMRAAIDAYRPDLAALLGEERAHRLHSQLAMTCAGLRLHVLHQRAADAAGTNKPAWRKAELLHARDRKRLQRARGLDAIGYRGKHTGRFAALTEGEAARAKAAAWLPSIGLAADETRAVLPIVLRDGSRRFILRADIRSPEMWIGFVKSDGSWNSSRRSRLGCYGSSIERIVPARQPRAERVAAPAAPAEPAGDVAALSATLAAVLDRLATVEAQLAQQTADPVDERAAAVVIPADNSDPVAPAAVDPRDAYIAQLIAERDAQRERAEAAEARAADFERLAKHYEGAAERADDKAERLADKRARTGRRMVQMRARLAGLPQLQRELQAMQAELDRIRPLAAAVAAFAAAAAPAGNVVALRAA